MYDDLYFNMQLVVSEHSLDDKYNGIYKALDYFYNSETRYIHFKNINGEAYIWYVPYSGETNGYWCLNENEGQTLSDYSGGYTSDCSTYMCLFYIGIV